MLLENAHDLRFLVADDSVHIRKIIKAVCFNLGVRNISEAADGRAALELIETRRKRSAGAKKCFDLIICDWMMPELNGLDLLHTIRRDNDADVKQTPFLMVTAEGDKNRVVEAIKEGVSDYIVKPFTADILEAKIGAVLRRHRPKEKGEGPAEAQAEQAAEDSREKE